MSLTAPNLALNRPDGLSVALARPFYFAAPQSQARPISGQTLHWTWRDFSRGICLSWPQRRGNAQFASILCGSGGPLRALVRLRTLEEAALGQGALGFRSAFAIMCHPDLSVDPQLSDAVHEAPTAKARGGS